MTAASRAGGIFINFVPIIGNLWAFVETGFLPGTEGDNRYGPDPKTASLTEVRR